MTQFYLLGFTVLPFLPLHFWLTRHNPSELLIQHFCWWMILCGIIWRVLVVPHNIGTFLKVTSSDKNVLIMKQHIKRTCSAVIVCL